MTKLKKILIILVLGISTFTHLYRIGQTYVFQNDEGRDALIAFRMIDSGRPILLGPETSVGNMYLGPFYYYLMAPSLWLSGLDPVGPAIMVAILAVATTYLLVILGKKYSSETAGLFTGLFYALSPVMIHYSRSSWNPNVIPFFISLMLLIYPFKKNWHFVVFGILTGIIFQLHYVALIVPALIVIHHLVSKTKSRDWSIIFSSLTMILLGFLISTSPFWLFEARHGFINSRAFMTYLLEKGGADNLGYPPYFTRLYYNFKLIALGMIGSSSLLLSPLSLGFAILIFILLGLFFIFGPGLLTWLVLGSLLIVSFLKENIHVHYLAFLFPLASLIIGILSTHKNLAIRIATIFLILGLSVPNFKSLEYNLGQIESTQPRRAREVAEYINAQAAGRPYNIVNASSGSSATILYYLAISQNPPRTELSPVLFVLCENALCPAGITTNPQLFLNGPSHPTLIDYLGYVPSLDSHDYRRIVKNEWVTYDIFVATITRDP